MNGLYKAVRNNIPGLLQEMTRFAPGEDERLHRLGAVLGKGFLRANGPIVRAHMQTFAFKTGFALYHEATGKVIPKGGAVAARWFSNFEHMTGQFPATDYDFLIPPQTLRQGKFEVANQFSYQWGVSADQRIGAFVSHFRESFSVIAFAAVDSSILSAVDTNHPIALCRPGEITTLLTKRTDTADDAAAS